ncbi:hypothetical protein [Frankia sp. Cas3]|uniref:hypothetical protein n=1 Tax=Frankia sp. Cas3 TaxID=3073926 RepID=UPI002AD4700B|nr:hypothetical protein [Frankia sp. Cas3]
MTALPSVELDINTIIAKLKEEPNDLAKLKAAREHAYLLGRHAPNMMIKAEHRDALTITRLLGKRAFDEAFKAGWDETMRARASQHEADKPPTVQPTERPQGKPWIEAGDTPETIRTLTAAVDEGEFDDLYVTNGEIVQVGRISGDIGTDSDDPLPLASAPLTAAGFASLLAHKAYVFKICQGFSGAEWEEECTPPDRVLAAVLSGRHWPGVRPLRGIVSSPILRPDGSLLQTVGYDRATGLYYAPKVALRPVPEHPSREQVISAKRFIGRVLHDFPWVSDADRATYLGLLVSPILRPYVRALIPFGLVTATTQASGKTLLTDIAGALYGKRQQPWPESDEELRKVITSVLAQPESVIVFDNLEEGTQIKSPILAGLLTATEWSDRILGSSKTAKRANDRMWLATGNNIRLGGDMATRTAVVRLDPNMPNPDQRSGFAIPDLETWLTAPANRHELMWHVLVLVADWMTAGAPRSHHVMRQFTPWAQAAGGFVTHHGLPGFLANATDVREMDDAAAMWQAFLSRWEQKFGAQPITSAMLRASFERDPDGSDPWEGTIPDTLLDGRHIPSVIALGKRLRGQVGRWFGSYVLREATTDSHNKVQRWEIEKAADL